MKFKLFIDKSREEECIIYANEKSCLVEEIERMIMDDGFELVGYKDDSIIRINPSEVFCFIVENGRTYAITENGKLLVKNRLYQLEENLTENFIKINQSCIANIKKILQFDASLSGMLRVVFKNGHIDYVSRRQVKNVKERLGV